MERIQWIMEKCLPIKQWQNSRMYRSLLLYNKTQKEQEIIYVGESINQTHRH